MKIQRGTFRRLAPDVRGATKVEYALILALAVGVTNAGVAATGSRIRLTFTSAVSAFGGGSDGLVDQDGNAGTGAGQVYGTRERSISRSSSSGSSSSAAAEEKDATSIP